MTACAVIHYSGDNIKQPLVDLYLAVPKAKMDNAGGRLVRTTCLGFRT